MPAEYVRDYEIVPGYTLIRKLATGMAGEVWIARASGGVRVAVKIINDLELLGSKRELGALRVVREVKHPNLCPLIGVWFFDRDGKLFDPSDTDLMLLSESSAMETQCVDADEASADALTQPFDSDFDTPQEPINGLQPSRMVLAMGLGEKTLFDRLVEVRSRNLQKSNAVDGASTKLEPCDGIPAEELLRYMASSASAIDELNIRHSIYHCDIKPQNILIVGGQAQVCDFGLARQVENEYQTQLAFGTPAYGAPEMLFGRTYSRSIDQYSLAMTYYHLRTGRLPYEGMTQSSYLKAKASGNLDLSRLPKPEIVVIARATDLDPESRYQNCQTFVAALTEAVHAPPVTAPNRKRFAAVGVSAIFLVAGAATLIPRLSSRPRPNGLADTLPEKPTSRANHALVIDTTSEMNDASTADEIIVAKAAKPAIKPAENNDADWPTLNPSTIDRDPRRLPPATGIAHAATASDDPIDDPITEVPAKDDCNHAITSHIQQQRPNREKLLAISRSLANAKPSDLVELSLDNVDSVITLLGEHVADRYWSARTLPDRSSEIDEEVAGLYRKLATIVEDRFVDQANAMGQLALIDAQISGLEPTEGVRELAIATDALRALIDEDGRFVVPEKSAEALITLCRSAQHPGAQDWNLDRADREIQWLRSLSLDNQLLQSVSTQVQGEHLIRLLRARNRASAFERLNRQTLHAIEPLDSEENWSSIAHAASRIIQPAVSQSTPLAHPRQALPESYPRLLPDDLKPLYDLALGWSAWDSSNAGLAFACWKRVSADRSITATVAKADREQAAKYVIDRLIRSAVVDDDDFVRSRYSTSHRMVSDALGLPERLAADSDHIIASIDRERFFCEIAAHNYVKAAELWERIGTHKTVSPQLGRALQHLAINRIESSSKSKPTKWLNLLAIACVRQAASIDDLSIENESTDWLIDEVFRPAMEHLSPTIKELSRDGNAELDLAKSNDVKTFCERFVQLAAVPHRRKNYDDLSRWWSDVQTAALFAAKTSDNHARASQLFSIAFDAYLQVHLEQQDDVTYGEATETLASYWRETARIDGGPASDALQARVLARESYRASNPSDALEKYGLAIGKFDSAVKDAQASKSPQLADLLRERSLASLRVSKFVDDARAIQLRQDALNDARQSVAADLPWHSNREMSLANLADVCGQIVVVTLANSSDTARRQKLLDEGNRAIDDAIERRVEDSFDLTNLALKKLVLLHIDLIANQRSDPARFAEKQEEAAELIQRWSDANSGIPVETNLRVDSQYLNCFWHSAVSQLHVDLGAMQQAMPHSAKAFQLASTQLDARDRLFFKVILQYVGLRSTLSARALESGQKPELASELIEILERIESPPPDIEKVKSAMANMLRPYVRK
tara:strand:- start:34182 stop:38303 length:4122 start_codon:yes stop_codon:yes gene_type:complete